MYNNKRKDDGACVVMHFGGHHHDHHDRDDDRLTQEEAMAIGIRPAVYRGEPGKSPRIGEDGCWLEYDDEKREWVNTGVRADGGGAIFDGLIFDGGDAFGERIVFDGGSADGN